MRLYEAIIVCDERQLKATWPAESLPCGAGNPYMLPFHVYKHEPKNIRFVAWPYVVIREEQRANTGALI